MLNSDLEVLRADSWRKQETGREFLEAGAARYGVDKNSMQKNKNGVLEVSRALDQLEIIRALPII